jgi:hypothetical protein
VWVLWEEHDIVHMLLIGRMLVLLEGHDMVHMLLIEHMVHI